MITRSTNQAVKQRIAKTMFSKANVVIEGPNITSSVIADFGEFGSNWGSIESGGIAHFKNLNQ